MGIREAAPQFRRVGVGYSAAATAVMVGTPVAAVLALARGIQPGVSPLLLAFVATLVAVAVSAGATAAWMRHPASESISFGELMLWSWLRRSRSYKAIAHGAEQLDRSGTSPMTAAERMRVLRQMSGALDRKDPYTYGHSRRVERFAYSTGLALCLDAHELDVLRVAAAIHDVGKIHVPDEVLRKEGPLTQLEYLAVKAHAAMGAEMVAHMGKANITLAVRHHHERFDGAGYPDGIAGEDIPLSARIIGVVDAYDAMTSTRSYRSSLGRRRAIEILREESGRQFDPEVVAAFLSTLSKPVAVVLALPALSAPTVVRRIAQWFGRGTRTQVATAAGSVGIAIALSTSLGPPVQPPARVAVERHAVAEAPEQVLGTRVRANDPKQRVRAKKKPAAKPQREGTRKRNGRREARRGTANSTSAEVASGDGGSTTGGSGTGSGSAPVIAAPVGSDADEQIEEEVKKTQEWDPAAEGDPQPVHGQDCSADVASTKGGAVHCEG